MFSEAIAIAGEYTRPIIVTKRTEDQNIMCGMATFIVVNDAGWALTAAHVLQDALVAQQHKVEREKYQSLGGHLKTGQWWTGQNRPTDGVRD